MAIYNQRVKFTRAQLLAHYLKRNSMAYFIYGILRFAGIIVENIYCISSYLFLSWIVLLPISWIRSDLYSKAENYLYNSLLFIVSSWSLAAGTTVVEAGDDYKQLIEEPENQLSVEHGQQKTYTNNTEQHKVFDDDACNNHGAVSNGYSDHLNSNHYQQNHIQTTELRQKNSSQLLLNGTTDVVKTNDQSGDTIRKDHMPINGIKLNYNRQLSENRSITAENDTLKNNNNIEIKNHITAKKSDNGNYTNGTIRAHLKDNNQVANVIDRDGLLLKSQAKPRILLLCNHISTADVPLIMQSFSTLTNQSLLWVLDAQFKPTNFGVVCGSHGDFFVAKNSFTEGLLRDQVLKHPDRNLLILFPEGGFLRKRIEGSNRYAIKNGLPLTKYVTHPRFGAFKDLIDPSVGVTHIIDTTLLYDDIKNPLSILDIAFGTRKEPVILNYKVYQRSEINPTEEWLRNIWLEKDRLMTRFYEDRDSVYRQFEGTLRVAQLDWYKVLSVHLFYLLFFYLAIFRLFSATSVTMLKARELYYSNI